MQTTFILPGATYNSLLRKMSTISTETTNENQLTVEEYVRFIKLKEHVSNFIENAKIREILDDSEETINGLTIDLTINYSINKRKN